VLWGQDQPQSYLIHGTEMAATVDAVANNGRLTLRFEDGNVQSYDMDEVKWVDPN